LINFPNPEKSDFGFAVFLEGKVEFIHGDDVAAVANLKEKGFKSIYVDGGALIQSFLKADRVHRLIVSKIPILLGAGISLFPKAGPLIQFDHQRTEIFSNGIVKSEYRKKS